MRDRWLYAWGLGSVAFGGASLLVPLYVVQLGGNAVDLGVLAATAAVIGAPGAILFGSLANRVAKRRRLVLVTLTTVALTLAVIPLFETTTAIIVANAALWLVVASVSPVLTMVVVDDAPPSTWGERIGRLNTYQGYGWAGGLVLGATWPVVASLFLEDVFITKSLFWLLAGCASVAVVAASRTLPRPPTQEHVTSDSQIRHIARVLERSNRGIRGNTFAFSPNRLYWATRAFNPGRVLDRHSPALWTYFTAATLFFTGFAAFWAPLPLFFTETGFTTGEVFALYLVSSLGSAVFFERAGRFASRVDNRVLQSSALAVRGVVFPVIAALAGLGGLTLGLGMSAVALVVVGLTWAVIAVVGTQIVTRLAPPSIRGEVLGIHTALMAVAGGIGGVLGGWVATFGYTIAFGVAGVLVLAGSALVLTLRVLSSKPSATNTRPTDMGSETD